VIHGKIDYSHYLLNIGIMFPSIFLLIFVSTYILPYVSAAWIALIVALFFLKQLVPRRYKQYVYPVAIMVFLLLVLNTLALELTQSILPILSELRITLSFGTMATITFALGLVTVAEGLISPKVIVTIGESFGSLVLLIEQLGIVAVMLTGNQVFLATESGVVSYLAGLGVYGPNPYIVAFITTVSLEAYALYNLLIFGYQFYLPLTVLSTPVDSIMPFIFMISAGSILISLYVKEKRNIASRLGMIGTAGIAGALVALPILLVSQEIASYGYQIFVIGLGVTILLIVVAITSRKVPANETINTSLK